LSLRATAGASAAGLAVGWNVGNVGAIAPTLSEEYVASLAAIGLLTTALFIVHLGVQIPGGRLIDATGARRISLAGVGILLGGNALALVAPDLGLGLAARAVTGVGTGLAFIAGAEYVRTTGGSPLAQGVYGGVNLGGAGLALAVVPQLEGSFDWRAPYLSAIFLSAIALVVLALGPADRPTGATPAGRSFLDRSPLRPRGLLRLAALHTASFGLNVVVGTWIVALLVESGGYGERRAGAVGALTLLGGIVSRPLGGWIVRTHPCSARGACAGSLVAGALATGALAWAGPAWAMAPVALVVGLAAGIPFAAAFTGAARARPLAPGTAVAFVNASAGTVILGFAPLIGLAFDLPGDGRIGFLVTAALWAAALLVLPSKQELGVVPEPALTRSTP
jgi:MFS family permease